MEIPRLRARRGDEGIAPYGPLQGVRSCDVSPSVTAKGRDTSLTEGGRGFLRPRKSTMSYIYHNYDLK